MKNVTRKKRNALVAATVLILLCTPLLSNAESFMHHPSKYQHYDFELEDWSHSTDSHHGKRDVHHVKKAFEDHHHADETNYRNLTNTQMKQLEVLRLEYENKRLPMYSKLKSLELKINTITLNRPVNKDEVRTTAQEIAPILGELYLLKVEQDLAEQDIVVSGQ